MNPTDIGTIIGVIILTVLGGSATGLGAATYVKRKETRSLNDKYTEALESNQKLNKRLDILEAEADRAEAREGQFQTEISALNGKLDLLEEQRVEQEKRHTQEMMAVATDRETHRQTTAREIKELQKQVEKLQQEIGEVRKRNNELERLNRLLEDRQQDCEETEQELARMSTELIDRTKERDEARKEIDRLKKIIRRLHGDDDPPPTEPDDQAPPKPGKVLDMDGAKTDAKVDLPVTKPRDEDAA